MEHILIRWEHIQIQMKDKQNAQEDITENWDVIIDEKAGSKTDLNIAQKMYHTHISMKFDLLWSSQNSE